MSGILTLSSLYFFNSALAGFFRGGGLKAGKEGQNWPFLFSFEIAPFLISLSTLFFLFLFGYFTYNVK